MRRLDWLFVELKRGEQCRLCGNKQDLQVHHIDEDRSHNNLSNLIVLCRSCHSKQHRSKEWGKKMKETQDFSKRKRGKNGRFK